MKNTKYLFLIVMTILFFNSALFGQSVLTAGDIAIIGVKTDNPDSFSFVALTDMELGTAIKFTDNGWKSNNTFRANEGTVEWTSSSAITAGTVITLGTSGDFNLSDKGDQVLAYQGSESSPSFIYAVHTDSNNWQSTASDSNTSALPTGLENGVTAVAVGASDTADYDNAWYSGATTSGTKAELLTAISNNANWTGNNTTYGPVVSSFTVTSGGNNPPTVSTPSITPSTGITSSTTVSVSADVTDTDGTITGVVLKWGTTSGSLTNDISMTIGTANTYTTTANIPAQAKGTEVFYQVSATDNASAVTTTTETSYTVLSNVTPTIASIIQTPAANIPSSTTVSVSATITDSDGTITGAVVKWGTATGVLSNSITMNGSGSTYTTTPNIPAQLNNTTVYYEIIATDSDSETSTSTEASYTVRDPLAANFTASSTIIFSGNPITFTNTTTGGIPNLNYGWTFGDGGTSSVESPVYTYTTTGNYTVTLTVTDGNRASSSKTLGIEVKTAPAGATDLFFSEYIEGSSSSKALEIFNGTGHTVDLTHYSVKIASNANNFVTTFPLPGTLLNGEVFVIANSGSAAAILAVKDAISAVAGFDGNDAIGLFKNNTLIDIIGVPTANVNQSVAGTTAATADHTLVRKADVVSPTTNWATSAGTNTTDSQWTVYAQNEFSYIGSHVFTSTTGTALFADFTANITSGPEPLTVKFTNFVTGGSYPYLFSWDFDEDGIEDSSAPHPTFTFTQDGTYSVSLYVLDELSGTSTKIKTDYITVSAVNIDSYYSSITNQTGETLKADLKTLVGTNTLNNYNNSRAQMYSVIDNINNKITGVYTGIVVDQNHGDGSTPIGISCEHSYPQSWLDVYLTSGNDIAKADIHHLFPVKTEVNSSRGDSPFDDVNAVLNSFSEATGYTSFRGTNLAGKTVFEVADQHKGNTARAMLYMNTRWDLPLEDDGFLPDGTTVVALNINMLPTLLQWSKEDPVDQAEIDRNEAIFAYQGNRNPFVNNEDWITSIYGNPQVTSPVISPATGNYVNSTEVSMSCTTNGASIYYTTNGSTPTSASALYSGSFDITATTTIKAIATKSGYDDSEVITRTYTITTGVAGAGDLFFSEYVEGGSNNKALEIYNGTGSDIDFTTNPHSVKIAFNAGTFGAEFSLTGTLKNGEVFLIVNSSAIAAIKDIADVTIGSNGVTSFNGDDAIGLYSDGVLIDIIGVESSYKKQSVAGEANATENRTLVRKASVVSGNTDWTTSAGTNASDSEWIVYPQDTFTYLNSHRFAETDTSVEPTVGTLFISEISDATSAGNEYMELYNNSNSVLSLKNIKIRKDLNTDYDLNFTGSYTGERDILPHSYFIISQSANKAAFQTGFTVAFDVKVGYLQGESGMGFDGSHRWQLIHGTNSKAEIIINDSGTVNVGGTDLTYYQNSPGSWSNENISGSTPGSGHDTQTLPVTLTSFTSSIIYSGLGQPLVSISWKTEAESGLIGYNILRNETPFLEGAVRNNAEIVTATNSLIGNNYNYVDEQVELFQTYYYWLESVELSNENQTFGPINIRVENNNSNGVVIPYQTSLRGVYPNPFNPTTTVSFYVKNPDRVKIKVFNVKGQQIKELVNEVYQPGFHKLNWNGQDQNNNACASGIYFFKMETRTENQIIKGILLK